jgi:hypothetical protein
MLHRLICGPLPNRPRSRDSPMQVYYAYRLTCHHPETVKRYYIGFRSCRGNPVTDPYWSSSKPVKEAIARFGPEAFTKKIIAVYPTKKNRPWPSRSSSTLVSTSRTARSFSTSPTRPPRSLRRRGALRRRRWSPPTPDAARRKALRSKTLRSAEPVRIRGGLQIHRPPEQ